MKYKRKFFHKYLIYDLRHYFEHMTLYDSIGKNDFMIDPSVLTVQFIYLLNISKEL